MNLIIKLTFIILYQTYYAKSDKDICSDALGIQSGKIKDFQMSAVEAYESDMSKYGPKNARLMKTSSPQGYRGNKNKPEMSWVSVDLGRRMVVTWVATQGYGNSSVQEWITEFNLMYSVDGRDFNTFKDANGKNAKFVGNKDFNTVNRQKVPFPVIASKITILPTKWNKNVGLRIEVYGCQPDFKFRAILMLSGRAFTMNYRNNQSYDYTVALEESTFEDTSLGYHQYDRNSSPNRHVYSLINKSTFWNPQAITYWNSVPGFLGLLFKGFSPQKSPSFFTLTAAEFEVYCLESTLANLLKKMKDFIKESDIFDSTFYEIQYPRTNMCSPPTLNILPLANDDSRSIAIIKGSIPTFTIDFTHDCKLPNTLIIQWNTAFIDDVTSQMSPLSPKGLNSRKVTLDLDSFDTSIIYLECVAYTLGLEGNFVRDFRFIRIIEASLVAKIEGFRYAIKGGNNIIIDGSKSNAQGDPEFLNDINLDFSWFCQKRKSNYTNVGGYTTQENSSCFGKPIAEIISKKKVLNIDNNDLTGGMEYVFQLVVNANGVAATADHTATVELFTNISIRCISNCLRKINPTEKQLLGCGCTGSACVNLIEYEWSFFLLNKQTKKYKAIELVGNITSVFKSGKQLQINNFEQLIGFKNDKEEEFEIRLAAYIDNLAYVQTKKYFVLNAVPSSQVGEEGCSMVPRVGYAMNTYFNMSCENWKDDDLPLTYKFQYVSEFGMIILQSGYSPRISSQLLPGNNASNFTYDIIITVTDSLGAPQQTRFQVKVLLPSASEAKSMIKNIDNELNDLLNSGNPEKAADMSLFAISLLNTFDKNPVTEIKTKNNILQHLSKAKTASLAQVSKFGVVVKTTTNQTERLGQQTQKDAMNLIENACTTMTSIVVNKSSDVNLGLIQFIAENFVTGVSNVLNSSLGEVNTTLLDSTEVDIELKENAIEQKKQISKKSDTVIKDVAATITSLMNVGDAPRVVRSNNVAVRVERNTPASFDRKVIGEGRSKIILPPSQDMLLNTNSTPKVMDCQIIEYPVNPFFWHKSSTAVKSSVLDVSIYTDTDDKMKLSLLENPINLFLPRKNPDPKQFAGRNYSAVDMSYYLKPGNITNTTEYMRYHKILIPTPYDSVTMILIPQTGEYIEVFIRAKKRPTPLLHFYKKILPDLSSCNDANIKTFSVQKCTSDPYKLEISSNTSGTIGIHYIGLRHVPQKPDEELLKLNDSILNEIKIAFLKLFKRNRKEVNDNRTSTGNPCKSNSGRQKRSCVGVKDPPTTPPNNVMLYPTFNPLTDVKYHLDSYLSSCLFWSEEEEKWKSDGCKLGTKSSYNQVHCLCHHLTAFGGDVVIAPNPIEFDKVMIEFARLKETGNFVVLSTVLLMWGVFAVGLIMARRADMYDKLKIVNCGVETTGNKNSSVKTYKISIHTGVWLGSGTTANVGMILYSVGDYSEPIYFNNTHLDKRLFARGSVNTFYVDLQSNLKDLFKIKIWHDNFGEDPSWFIKDVVVSDEDEEERWYFLVNRWLAVNKGDHKILADFLLTEEKEVKKFKNRFYSRAAKQFTNAHLWLSVFTRNIHSPFTRCQRLGCCFLVLMATMVTNAMFYQFGSNPTDVFLVGPFEVSVRGIKTSLQSCLIVLPISVFIILIFENVKQNQADDDEEEKLLIVKKKVKGFIPKPFVLFAWFLCISGAAVSSAFTIFYSLMWGAEIANQWLASIMMSFIQDVLFIQPIKIIVLVSLLAMIIKKPVDHHKEVNISEKRVFVSCRKVEIPPTEDLAIARDMATKTSALKRVIMEYLLYLLFILLLFIVCYGNRDTNRFMVTNSIKSMVANFEEVKDNKSLWKWIEDEAIPKMFEVQWYNAQPFSEPEGFLKNRKMFLVGMPRLRQLRIKPDNECLKGIRPDMASKFQRCIPQYSMFTEQNSPYNLPKWKVLKNRTAYLSNFQIEKLCPIPWRYRDFNEIQTLPFWGTTTSYGGGGFVADLGYEIATAKDVVRELQKNEWIDGYTSALFLEFTLFNPATSLFSTVKFLFERMASGSLNALNRIDTIIVYSPTNKSLLSFLQMCQFLLMVIIIALMISECVHIYQNGRSYFKDIWNLVQWLQIVSIICAIVMFYFKEKYTNSFIAHLQVNPFETSSADYIVMWSDLETIVLSFVIFIVTIKLIRLIRYNPLVCQLNNTLKRSAKFIRSFSVLFLVVMLGLGFMATLAFGRFSYDFSSLPRTLSKLIQLLVGGKIYQKDINFSQSPIAPLFVLLYTAFTSVILVNILLSILIESFKTSRKCVDPQHLDDLKFGMFMKNHLRQKVASGQEKINKILRKTLVPSHKGEVYVRCSHNEYDDLRNGNEGEMMKVCSHRSRETLSVDFTFDCISCISHERESYDEDVQLKDIRGSLAEISSTLKRSISDVDITP